MYIRAAVTEISDNLRYPATGRALLWTHASYPNLHSLRTQIISCTLLWYNSVATEDRIHTHWLANTDIQETVGNARGSVWYTKCSSGIPRVLEYFGRNEEFVQTYPSYLDRGEVADIYRPEEAKFQFNELNIDFLSLRRVLIKHPLYYWVIKYLCMCYGYGVHGDDIIIFIYWTQSQCDHLSYENVSLISINRIKSKQTIFFQKRQQNWYYSYTRL